MILLALTSALTVLHVGSTILTDPGPLCSGQTAVLTCNVTEGTSITWSYNSLAFGQLLATGPPPTPVEVGGVTFTVTSPHLVSQLSFVASEDQDGAIVLCEYTSATGASSSSTTLQVETINAAPEGVSRVNTVPGGESSTVTIEWTPPTSGVSYTITTTPVPISPTMPVTITPDNIAVVQTNITVRYNTDYTVTVSVQSCDGPREASTTVRIVNCFRPVLSRGVVLIADPSTLDMILANTATLAGDEIMYNCREGFQPGTIETSVCGDNGLWDPDPTLYTCTVDCGPPLFPSTGTGTVSETTEGAMATFQCEEGLLPSGLLTSTCTDTGQTGGQWIPDPADIQCRNSSGLLSARLHPTFVLLLAISPETTPTTTTQSGGAAAAAIGGAVAGMVAAIIILIIIVIIVIICVRKHKDKPIKKNVTSRHGGLGLQAQPIEYNTIGSRGYQPDSTTDEYSTVQHNRTPQHKPSLESEYSLVGDNKNTVKGVGNAAPPPPPETGTMYAALNLAPARYRKPHPPPPGGPLYEDIEVTTTRREEIKLEDNVAYGHIST